MRAHPALTMLILSLSLGGARPGAAYVIATTQDGLHELHWTTDEVPYSVHFRGAADVHEVLLQSALIAAFESWGEVPTASLRFQRVDQYSEPVSEADGINLLYWTEGAWPHEAEVIALTSINYYPDTGEIVDVDIDFNGADYHWTVLDGDVQTDVQAIATHEIGHLLGLDHTGIPSAVMNPYYEPGETRQRTLQDDDVEGISAIYPCDSGDCGEPFVPAESGCSLAGSGGGARWWILGLVAAALALRRRSPAARLPVTLWALATAALPATPPGASVVAPSGLLGTMEAAESVVVARVGDAVPFLGEDGRVHRRVALAVERRLVGEGGESLELDVLGGELAHLGTYVPGAPGLERGQLLVLALAPRLDGSPGIVALAAGVVEIDEQAGFGLWRPQGPDGDAWVVDVDALARRLRR